MRNIILILILSSVAVLNAQVVLDADGSGDTYGAITSVLAPGYNPIEVPDCNHEAFGNHIDEVFDDQLMINVFRFHIHTSPDNDRCIKFDRQRNEIKSYDKSPDNLLGVEGETVVYNWKFNLSHGFQSSPNFTHLHQLKSVGGPLASMPMYTLTTRKGNPDKLELRYAETDKQVTLLKTELSPFIGQWMEVTETIRYGTLGTYAIEIINVLDGSVLFTYSNYEIINWREDAEFVRPKWGIYRSLINQQDLRDETVLFANFRIEEMLTVASFDHPLNHEPITILPNPAQDIISLYNIPERTKLIELFDLKGQLLIEKRPNNTQAVQTIDVSTLSIGVYVVRFSGIHKSQPQLIVVSN